MITVRVVIEPIDGVSSRVTLGGVTLAAGPGAVVCQAARVLLSMGYSPRERLEAWRGPVLCLSGPLSAFASRTVSVTASGRPSFTRYADHSAPSHGSKPAAE